MEILEITNTKDLRDFIDLPWRIYKNYPNWVPPLKKEVEENLSRKKNPFFKHSEATYFTVKEGKETLGRIAAINNRNHNSFHDEKIGFFGFFETIQEYKVSELLFGAAEDWCRKRELRALRGPASFSTNDQCGLLIEGFDRPPLLEMPYNPPYYAEYIEKYGFTKTKDLFAFLKTPDEPSERILKLLERVRRKNIIIENIKMEQFSKEVQNVKDIYNSSWNENWGFVPMTDAEMDHKAGKLKFLIDPELFLFAKISGKPVALAMGFPDYNQTIKGFDGRLGPIEIIKLIKNKKKINMARLMTLGVKKEYRNLGIELLLCYEILERCRKMIQDRHLPTGAMELSWTLEDNHLINKVIQEMGGVLYKKYRVYEKSI